MQKSSCFTHKIYILKSHDKYPAKGVVNNVSKETEMWEISQLSVRICLEHPFATSLQPHYPQYHQPESKVSLSVPFCLLLLSKKGGI